MAEETNGKMLAFQQAHRAWFGKHLKDTAPPDMIAFGPFVDGRFEAELWMIWYDLGDAHGPAPRLEVDQGAWAAFASEPLRELIDNLGALHGQHITPGEFRDLLVTLGFVDKTPIEKPAH